MSLKLPEIQTAPYRRPLQYTVLSGLTAVALLFVIMGFTTSDPEGRMFGLGFGGMGVAFVAPFWIVMRGKAPLWAAAVIAISAVLGMMKAIAWDAGASGTIYSHMVDYFAFLYYSVPGVIAIIIQQVVRRNGRKRSAAA